jgi:hypothetical protein
MKLLLTLTIAAVLMLGLGCSDSKVSAPNEETLNFNIIGDDTPESVEAGIAELAELEIEVPDPVTDREMAELATVGEEADLRVVDRARLEENHRLHFRRILRHLHRQFQGLRECLAENQDPQLRRVVYGALLATQRGLHALRTGHPRIALHAFHLANRLLNLAHRICYGEDDGRGRG